MILGAGYVGLTLGIGLARVGHSIRFIEIDSEKKDAINQRQSYFYETDIDQEIGKCFLGSTPICFSSIEEALEHSRTIDSPRVWIITLGTPLDDTTRKPNFHTIETVYSEILSFCDLDNDSIILRSTVAIGTSSRLLELHPNFRNLSFCPERTVEGNALAELSSLPTVFAGASTLAVEHTRALFSSLTKDVIAVETLEGAEAVKLVCNAYRDYSFAFANLMSEVCIKWGIDYSEMRNAAMMGYGRSSLAVPGPVGGPCLEKDSYILEAALSSESDSFLLSARKYNETYAVRMTDSWLASKPLGPSSKVVLAGAAFKGDPPTSDLRGSHIYGLVDYFLRREIPRDHIWIIDPYASGEVLGVQIVNEMKSLPQTFDYALITNKNALFDSHNFFNALVLSRCVALSFWQLSWIKGGSLPSGWLCMAGGYTQ